ncbi:MAG: Tad domain-containing protein, partial [Alphaproteobacteria bacterium]
EAMKKVSKSFPELSRSRARSLARDEGGAIAVMLALMLAALLGVMALAMDLGQAWNLETELQHAADACALAGVTQLDGNEGARARAIEACVVDLAPALIDNEQRFATDGQGSDVTFSKDKTIDGGTGIANNPDIKFYTQLPIEVANIATSDAEARLIEANVAPRTVDFSFSAVVGAVTSASPSARAVAGWETMSCDNPPMMMCNPNETVNEATGESNGEGFNLYTDCPDSGRFEDARDFSCIGRGVTMKEHGKGAGLLPGEFGFLSLSVLDFDGNVVDQVAGANVLKEFLASVSMQKKCTGNWVQTEPGDMISLGKWINVRFDMYWRDAERNDENYQPAGNTIKDLVLRGDWNTGETCAYNVVSGRPTGSSDWVLPPNPYDGPGHHIDDGTSLVDLDPGTGNPIDTMGYPRDYCAYLSEAQAATFNTTPPIPSLEDGYPLLGAPQDCIFAPPASLKGVLADRDQVGTGQWDIETYLEVHHPLVTELDLLNSGGEYYADLPNVFGNATINTTEGKDGFISRWEMYQWEMSKYVDDLANNMPEGGSGDEGEPICYKDTSGGYEPLLPEDSAVGKLDRRIMVLAIVNCADVGGGRNVIERVKPHGAIAVFMTEPMGGFDSGAMYGEYVDPLGLVGAGTEDDLPTLVREHIVLIE